ncbi:MAG: YifB family Mg chelatase-like AAA ATPase [bacterium]
MLARVFTASIIGIDGIPVEVEVDIVFGMPRFDMVGLPSEEVRESRFRVQSAMKNSGLDVPHDRVTVNLAPATLRKVGTSFDLPLAVGMGAASGQIPSGEASRYLIMGELSLDGQVKSIRGTLCMVSASNGMDLNGVVVPAANAREAAICTERPVYGVSSLTEVFGLIRGTVDIAAAEPEPAAVPTGQVTALDFSEIRGQEHARRAVEVAAAGGHNILMIGPPGSGKTMIARRIPTILPAMSIEEAIETTKIFSVAGRLKHDGLMSARPFRAPHHTVSNAALIGGGSFPRPGEVSLANHGVLFLDEFTEFKRSAIEVMRQPLEDRRVTIARAHATATFPASFMLIAAMNPCPCGNLTDPRKACRCGARDIDRYRRKISEPILDRIDIHIEVPPAEYRDISGTDPSETSEAMRARVTECRRVQEDRFRSQPSIFTNSQMPASVIAKNCGLDREGKALLRTACARLGLSARSYSKVLKIARTIADLDSRGNIKTSHLAEAVQYRSLDFG